MTDNISTLNSAEHLEALLVNGIHGELPIEQLRESLETVKNETTSQRFVLETKTSETVVFCAGSWAVRQLYGEHAVATTVTILGETTDGPLEVDLSPYHNKRFGIKLQT